MVEFTSISREEDKPLAQLVENLYGSLECLKRDLSFMLGIMQTRLSALEEGK